LDMPGALQALSASATDSAEPSGQYRERYAAMGAAAAQHDTGRVLRVGAEAIAIAEGQAWHALVVAARFLMGSALLSDKKPIEAHSQFVAAEVAAAQAEAAGEGYAKALRLKCRLAQAAALGAAEDWAAAATVYEQAAVLAGELGEARTELDCWRMASYSHEQVGAAQAAWKAALRAWALGKAMDEPTRQTSTLRYVAEAFTRLTEKRPHRDYAAPSEREMASLLGRDWRARAGTPVQAVQAPPL
jgi:hypothetical protein